MILGIESERFLRDSVLVELKKVQEFVVEIPFERTTKKRPPVHVEIHLQQTVFLLLLHPSLRSDYLLRLASLDLHLLPLVLYSPLRFHFLIRRISPLLSFPFDSCLSLSLHDHPIPEIHPPLPRHLHSDQYDVVLDDRTQSSLVFEDCQDLCGVKTNLEVAYPIAVDN